MRPVSSAYREAIQLHRTQGFRNRMLAEISFGVFADGAKEDSAYTITAGAPFSDVDNMYRATQEIATSYAMWEKDFFRLDGVQTFLPQSGFAPQGYVSATLADESGLFVTPPTIDITFGRHYSAVGLSFLFDSIAWQAAQEVTVNTYDGATLLETEVADNSTDAVDFKPELMLDGFDRMTIAFTKMKPYHRARLNKLLYGIGYVFGNDEIIGLKHKRAAHPLSLSLPQNELEFTLYNMNNQYDIDSPNSVVRFFEEEQEVTLKYGYDVSGNGDFEWFNGGVFYLYSWDTSGYQATFVAKDIFHKLNQTTFYKDWFGSDRLRTYAEKAAAVLDDAGVADYYVNDRYAMQNSSWLPLPYTSHAECLQILANMTRSTLDQDSNGVLNMRTREIPGVETWHTAAVPQNPGPVPQVPFSDSYSTINGNQIEYAMWEENFFRLDGNAYFLPGSGYLPAGLVLGVFPLENNRYEFPETGTRYFTGLYINMQRDVTFSTLKVRLSESARTTRLYIVGYTYNPQTAAFDKVYAKYHNAVGAETTIVDYFDKCQTLSIYPYDNTRYQRCRVLGVKVQVAGGLDLTDNDVLGSPKKELTAQTRNVLFPSNVPWYYTHPTYQVELMKATVTPGVYTEIKHSGPYYRMNFTCETPGVVFQVEEHYAYVSYVTVAGVTEDVEIVLMGGAYFRTATTVNTVRLNDTGQDAEIENPISHWVSHGLAAAEWAANYYEYRNQYEMDVLGYPECDAGDYITYNGKEVVVLENNITMDGGAMRGKMKLRGGVPYSLADTED